MQEREKPWKHYQQKGRQQQYGTTATADILATASIPGTSVAVGPQSITTIDNWKHQ